jgi:hypothetical protein
MDSRTSAALRTCAIAFSRASGRDISKKCFRWSVGSRSICKLTASYNLQRLQHVISVISNSKDYSICVMHVVPSASSDLHLLGGDRSSASHRRMPPLAPSPGSPSRRSSRCDSGPRGLLQEMSRLKTGLAAFGVLDHEKGVAFGQVISRSGGLI